MKSIEPQQLEAFRMTKPAYARSRKSAAKRLAAMGSEHAVEELRIQTSRFQKSAKKGENRELRDIEWIPRSTSGRHRASKGKNPVSSYATVCVSYTPIHPDVIWFDMLEVVGAFLNETITEEEWQFFYRWAKRFEKKEPATTATSKPRTYHRTSLA